ncbi:crotonobetainyl-CoA:carnitine CoA-transferase CaiB-like acyl-CoA transferase [Rhodopirellula rubra]|uniref:Crotonobetainyl-CoA:carnitine CoA-transferase CaiB-like acyl-CoA transferase n=1 Tax=Aporhodopirellula rubra TaxID=980271 RepID=A0A7W5H9R3_9BACT|nr:CaiB/BaiF CoA-transferase family protein [Aporhodopirellula rubra]MBB3210381.1 crotonobetainyl-CoA:carnitine CoA-transferase CaiB-like acyl-CoA transferase [Aporhodopirellula rubra]
MSRPLEGLVVLEFCQYLAGPWAGLRLADMGARVIKIERPGTGEACRGLATKNMTVDGDSLVFHTINRCKQSFTANLKNPSDLVAVKELVKRADVMTHNFRPGIMERLGMNYDVVRQLNPRLVYGEVSGYGKAGPWRNKPGQDLLAQSMTGLMFLTGRRDSPPVPIGVAAADAICGIHFAQGLLAALVRRGKTNQGALVEVSLVESTVDLQFEALTTYLNDGNRMPNRSRGFAAHPYQGAPYGVYPTADGHLALAMGSLTKLGELLGIENLDQFTDVKAKFQHSDDIRDLIAAKLACHPTVHWLERLEAADVWCAEVLSYEELRKRDGYRVLEMEQEVRRFDSSVRTLRSPVRIDGERLFCHDAAPRVGNDTEEILKELQRPTT